MLARLGFSSRLLLLIVLVLFAAWALGVGSAFVWRSGRVVPVRAVPFPEQAAAIVELVERAEPALRDLIPAAVGTETFEMRIVRAAPVPVADDRRLPMVEWVVSQYLERPQGREIIAFLAGERAAGGDSLGLGQYWIFTKEPLVVAVSLASGGYAVFETKGELARRVFGLPPGFWIGAVGALIGAAAILTVMREARPLRELSEAVARFAGDARPKSVPPHGAPEIRTLIGAFNDMQARIGALLKGRTVMLGAVSHDLKTYLTRLRLRVEAIPEDETRARAVRDIEDMTALIEDALAVARGGAVSDRRERVDLHRLVAEECAERAGAPLVLERPAVPVPPVAGDPAALRRLLANLIDNALRHGGRGRIALAEADGQVVVRIDDDGPGIPVAEREAVFEPFYRLEASRSRASGGAGLGLAIARAIVVAHAGTIRAEAAPQGGARLVVSLPPAPG